MRQIHKTVKLRVSQGNSSVTESFIMPVGFVKSMALYEGRNLAAYNYPLALLSLSDDVNVQVIPPTPIAHFKQTNGNYDKSFKPLNFDSKGESFALTLDFGDINIVGGVDLSVMVVFLMDTQVR